MQCPLCKLENHSDALICDYGYDFSRNFNDNRMSRARDPIHIQASGGKRFTHFFVDNFIVSTATHTTILFTLNPREPHFAATVLFFTFLAYFLYYVLMETMFGKTIGKFITRTTVLDEYGEIPSFAAILARTLIRWFPLDPLSFFMERPFHDAWSGTKVVDDQELLMPPIGMDGSLLPVAKDLQKDLGI